MQRPSEARPSNGIVHISIYLCIQEHEVQRVLYSLNYHVSPFSLITAVVMDKYLLDREDVVEQQLTKEEHEIKMKTNMAMLRINQLLPSDYDESYGVKR